LVWFLLLATSDSWLSSKDQNQGTRNSGAHAKPREAPQPFSSIRTLTVGLGIAPNLLTLFPRKEEGARGLGLAPLPPVGSFTPPWEHRPSGMNGLRANMTARRGAGKRPNHRKSWGFGMSPCSGIEART